MRKIALLLFLASASVCYAQTDSMIVESSAGNKAYSIPQILQLYFYPTVSSVEDQKKIAEILTSFTMNQNYPNPFNPSTTIEYSIPKSGYVEVNIFDIQGRLIRSLDKNHQESGSHRIIWDSQTDAGTPASSGTYICQVMFNNTGLVKKVVLIK